MSFVKWFLDNAKHMRTADFEAWLYEAWEAGSKAEQAEQEPVAWMSENGLVITDKGAANVWIENGFAVEPLYKATPPPSQKPIAWWNGAYDITMNSFEAREDWTPLYAAPVRTKDLSDDEIADALYGKGCWRLGVHPDHLREYRRVIAADRELNK